MVVNERHQDFRNVNLFSFLKQRELTILAWEKNASPEHLS
jgi:hypothetical protein